MKKIAIVLCLVLLVSAVMVGCQKNEETAPEASPAAATATPGDDATTAPSAEPTATPDSGAADGSVVGVWSLTSAEMEGLVLDADTLASFGMDEMTIEFKADGVVALAFGEEAEEATYVDNGDEIEISEDGEVVMTFVKEGSTLVVEEDGMKMIFTK